MGIADLIENPTVERDGVFWLDGHDTFKYSDGKRVEEYIYAVLKSAKDVSSSSRELEKYIKDWPTLYHFSAKRSLAYRSLKIPKFSKVLEVGCGCGSVTRYLGESADLVLALEGSPRRAKTAKERVRGLSSVVVLCASFQDVTFKSQFDFVICNGVLEYAPMFIAGPKPYEILLERLASLVKPGGTLIVAIENQFGLRYLSSGREEHTNIMYDGIEGYHRRPLAVRTFSAGSLEKMLKSHFENVELLFPLPDYKLPSAIIREAFLEHAVCAELYANLANFQFGSFVVPRMHERLVWHELESANLLREMSNSFLFICSAHTIQNYDENWMGDIYSLHRRLKWATRTRIYRECGENLAVREYLESGVEAGGVSGLSHSVSAVRWVNGPSIHTEIVRALCEEGNASLPARLTKPVGLWWQLVCQSFGAQGSVDGRHVDLNWQNVIIEHGGEGPVCIDNEWSLAEPVDLPWLIYRSVSKFMLDELYYSHRWSSRYKLLSPLRMMRAVGDVVGVRISVYSILLAVSKEREFQRQATGKEGNYIRMVGATIEPMAVKRQRRWLAHGISKITQRIAARLP